MKFSQLTRQDKNSERYMNPYVAGLLLGLTLLMSVFITGRGLGASGAIKSVVVTGVETVAPSYTANAPFFKDYSKAHKGSPMKSWLVFALLLVLSFPV